MADKDPNKLYDGIKTLQESLESIKNIVSDINDSAKNLIQDSAEFGGIVSKVFKEQMIKYFLPEVQKISEPVDSLINGDRVPGSLKDLTLFLDSVPLAMVRQEPTVSELASPVVPNNVDLATPASSNVENPVDNVPMNASYANRMDNVQESKNSGKRLKEYGIRDYEDNGFSVDLGVRVYYLWEQIYPDEDPLTEKGLEEITSLAKTYILNNDSLWHEVDALAGEAIKELHDKWAKKFPESKDRPNYTNFRENFTDSKDLKKKSLKEAEDNPYNVVKHLFLVMRKSTVVSPLGEDIANVEPILVYTFDNKEDAEAKVKELNESVLPEEKSLLGTEYYIEEKDIEVPGLEPYKDDKDLSKRPKKL